ncbi:nucleotidyltransferase-like protein [Paenibacillus selenitireducens]|nr:nucleotidyltransferase-like protein [Paenibacillus selenitireducens]
MMDFMKKTLLTEYINRPEYVGAICIEDTVPDIYPPEIYGFDMLLILVTETDTPLHETMHVMNGKLSVQVHKVSTWSMERWLVDGENRTIIQWLIQGEILQDHKSYLHQLRDRIIKFENPLREQRMLAEFTQFLRSYLQAKQFMRLNHEMDAYQRIIESLGHWAGIVLIEEGLHPEVSVWNQVHDINLGVYKLYEELTVSQETVGQRVELLLLACEFSVMSKMKECCSLLLRILSSRQDPWSTNDLVELPELNHVRDDLPLLLQRMVKRSLVREVEVLQSESLELDTALFAEVRYAAV